MRIFIKNSKGEQSVSLTMVVVSFILVSILYVLSAFDSIGNVKLRTFDSTATSIYFVTVCGLYFGRKQTDKKHDDHSQSPTLPSQNSQ